MKFLILIALILFTQSSFAQVLGVIKSNHKDCGAKAEVFIALRKQILFQVSVPIEGNFEVKLLPGSYDLTAINEKGCIAKKLLSFNGKAQTLTLELEPSKTGESKRNPAMMSGGMSFGPSSSMGYCPYCGFNSYNPNPFASPYYSYPYWGPFSQMNYQNHNYPCYPGSYYCSGSTYPRGGPIMMGKPNIYVQGPDRKNAQIVISDKGMQSLMLTAPAHLEKGWTFDLVNHQLKIGKAQYSYLFYDSRAEAKNFQSEKGFCGQKEQVLHQMIETLKNIPFPKTAIEDFAEYWSIKLPTKIELCVFPQGTDILNRQFPLLTNLPKPHWVRILFFVVPQMKQEPRLPASLVAFQKKPTRAWHPSEEIKKAHFEYEIFEWGLAFPHDGEQSLAKGSESSNAR